MPSDLDSDASAARTSRAEWVVAIVSTVLVLTMLAYTTYHGLTSSGAPPALVINVDSVVSTHTGFLVAFTVRNDGATTAAALHVEGTIRRDTTALERSEATIDYVPAHARRSGGLLFTIDPRQYALQLRATGYDRP